MSKEPTFIIYKNIEKLSVPRDFCTKSLKKCKEIMKILGCNLKGKMKEVLIIQTEVWRSNDPANNKLNEKLFPRLVELNLHIWFGNYEEAHVQEYYYYFFVLFFKFIFLLNYIYLLDWIRCALYYQRFFWRKRHLFGTLQSGCWVMT